MEHIIFCDLPIDVGIYQKQYERISHLGNRGKMTFLFYPVEDAPLKDAPLKDVLVEILRPDNQKILDFLEDGNHGEDGDNTGDREQDEMEVGLIGPKLSLVFGDVLKMFNEGVFLLKRNQFQKANIHFGNAIEALKLCD